MEFLTAVGFSLLMAALITAKPTPPANGIVSCLPGVTFMRDCGNNCTCWTNGAGADCSNIPCNKDFQTSQRNMVMYVWNHMNKLREIYGGPVYTCVPQSSRKINAVGGTCFCTSNGKSEVCSEHPGSPWGN